MRHKAIAGWALSALAVLLVGLASFRFSTPHATLNLGPGDSPFVSGFHNESDVAEKVGWHWTSYNAAIDLPFATGGADIDVSLRYARMFGEEARVDVSVGGSPTDQFRARGGEVRSTLLRAKDVIGPVKIEIKADSHERRDMGLRMDRLAVEVVSGDPLRLRPAAAVVPLAAIVFLTGGLLVLGASPLATGGLSLLAALAFLIRAWTDLFGAWRQVSLAPLMLVVSTLVLLLARKWLTRSGAIEKNTAVVLVVASLVTMLVRLTFVSHPDFYYPDLLTHARVVEAIRNEGPIFFLHPDRALNEQGPWTKPVLGSVSSLPYAVLFHTPFSVLAAMFDLSIDQIETALKSASCLISVLPILLASALATRLSLSPMCALLLCVIPAYTSRLSFALMPALTGHVFDLIVLLTIATRVNADGLRSRRSLLSVTGALLLGHLAYTSSVVNEGLFVSLLIAICLIRPAARSQGLRFFLAEGLAALLAFALYYRHFLGDVSSLVGRILGQGRALEGVATPLVSVYPIESFWRLLFERTDTFFGWSYLSLAVIGLAAAGKVVQKSGVVQAWVLAYLGLILLRAKIPDVFRYGHETLFVTPLVALLAGAALLAGFRRGGALRLASVGSGLLLAVVSFREQWIYVADQFKNAL